MPLLKDRYLQPEMTDPVMEENHVLEIVRAFVPEAKRVTKVDETGGEARMYAIDEDIIFKTQRPHRLRLSTSQAREVFYLKYLAEALPQVSVPRVLGYIKEGPMLEGTIMTRMPGTAVRYTEMSSEQRTAMLLEHGQAIAQLHSLDQKPFLKSGLFPNDEDAASLQERYATRFEAMLGRLGDTSDYEKDAARKLIEAVLAELNEVDCMVALHSNPYVEHTFVKSDKSYAGMIDFGDAYISHPVNDMRRWNSAERKTLLQGYFGGRQMSANFAMIWNITYSIDALTNMLSQQIQVSQVSDKAELLQWEW
ncbi:MAG: aminoglycoside phosphotransferase family protein [Symbiobacteriaceae bacterium]|nr:aminoglycoside phosphotransferase family protein [Symbiobacteriaceae bacterium]